MPVIKSKGSTTVNKNPLVELLFSNQFFKSKKSWLKIKKFGFPKTSILFTEFYLFFSQECLRYGCCWNAFPPLCFRMMIIGKYFPLELYSVVIPLSCSSFYNYLEVFLTEVKITIFAVIHYSKSSWFVQQLNNLSRLINLLVAQTNGFIQQRLKQLIRKVIRLHSTQKVEKLSRNETNNDPFYRLLIKNI